MLIPLILCIISAALWWQTTGLHPQWWAAWIAPLPLLWIARQAKSKWMWLGWVFAAWCIGSFNQWDYFTHQIRLPAATALIAMFLPGLVLCLAVGLWRGFMARDAAVSAALSFSLVWVVYEFALERLSVHSTFGSLAYSQVDFLPVLQLASLAGLAGITFLLFFVPGAVATGRWRAIVPAVVLLAAVVVWGRARLDGGDTAGERVPVGIISSDKFVRTPESQRQLLRDYAERAARLADEGARLIVIPEKIAVIKEIPLDEIDELFGAAAKHGARVVVGLERWTADAKLNEARVYSSNGAVEAVYEKHHMLPPMESHLLVGHDRVNLPDRLGVAICKDMDFPQLSREYAQDGAGLMIVPAWDFHSDGWLHSRMAVVRGVESGFGLVRSAKEGLLTVSDSRGRVIGEQRSDSAAFTVLVTDARVAHESTLYARWGDWFAWVCLGGLVLLLVSRAL